MKIRHFWGRYHYRLKFLFGCFSRLFLTMDPKHGEISRAMRNRGVEIYIPGEVGIISFQF